MNAKLNAEFENARQCLLETYQMSLMYGGTETQDEDNFMNLAANLITTQENAKRHEEALELAKEQRTLEDFEKEFQNLISIRMKEKFDVKKTAEYKKFKQQLLRIKQEMLEQSNITSGGSTTRIESDDFVMESEINVYDPLTKQRMQNPVRNSICNHHYEKSSILEAIKINKRLRCPVAGCGSKQFVLQQHLVDDNVFKMRLLNMAEQENS